MSVVFTLKFANIITILLDKTLSDGEDCIIECVFFSLQILMA